MPLSGYDPLPHAEEQDHSIKQMPVLDPENTRECSGSEPCDVSALAKTMCDQAAIPRRPPRKRHKGDRIKNVQFIDYHYLVDRTD